MPGNFTVCIWNVQNYGGGDPKLKFGEDSALRNLFIRDFVRAKGIDVLFILEASINAKPSLDNLIYTLNLGLPNNQKDWVYSFCGSAIKTTSTKLEGPDDVTFSSDARSEGYAVLWRTNQTNRFRMLTSVVSIASTYYFLNNPNPPTQVEPLNLNTTGRPAGNVDTAKRRSDRSFVQVFRALGGYTAPNVFPFNDGKLMKSWPKLEMPTTGGTNPKTTAWSGARRPAFVVVELNNGGATTKQSLCPLLAYHAPSNLTKASWGAFMSGLCRELYVTNDIKGLDPDPKSLTSIDNVIMGGDYNYEVKQADWPGDYNYYCSLLNQAYTGGAKCSPLPAQTLPVEDRRTTVQLLHHDHVTPITGVASNDYLRHMIDLLFWRGFVPAAGSSRPNLVQELMDPVTSVNYRESMQSYLPHLRNLVKESDKMELNGAGPLVLTKPNTFVPMITGSWGSTFLKWSDTIKMLKKERFTDARQAAEFYHFFISDHLPLVVNMTWP